MNMSFYLYFEQRNFEKRNNYFTKSQMLKIKTESVFVSKLMSVSKKNIIVIHWRCGDKLYGYYKSNYDLAKAPTYPLTVLKKEINALNLNFNDKGNIIYVLTQFDKGKARSRDSAYIDQCEKLYKIMQPYYIKLFFDVNKYDNKSIIVIDNGTVNTDSYLINYGNNIIQGGETSFLNSDCEPQPILNPSLFIQISY